MKITKIEDITDALLKEVTASSVAEFVAEEIKKANDQFLAQKSEKENELKAANEKAATLASEQEVAKKQLEELTQKLASLEAEQLAKAQEEAFNMRMASFDEEYELNDEERKVLASDVKDMNDESFSAYKNKMAIMMKDKSKEAKKAKMEKEQKMKASQEVKASEEVTTISTTQDVVEQAVDNGSKASVEIPNSAPVAEPTIREKYAKAFDFSGFEIVNK
jgi:chromosome segregation ATPase